MRSWTQIPNDEGALGTTARASLTQATGKFQHWPLELAFHSHNGHATCPFVIGRNVATLLTANLHPIGDTTTWAGNQISTSITSKIPITTDTDGCPTEDQPFPPTTKILQRLVPYGNTRSTTGHKSLAETRTAAHTSYTAGNYNGPTPPCAIPSHTR